MSDNDIIGHIVLGQGPQKVIILHGWWSDHTAYDSIIPFLDTNRFTYAFPDYRGYGKSLNMAGEHTIEQIAKDCIALADHLDWNMFHLVGHSMGGMAVQKVIQMVPNRVSSAVAITPVPACGSPLEGDRKPLFHRAAEQDENRIQILNYLTSSRLSESWYKYIVRRSRETTKKQAFHDYMLAWTETNFSDKVQGLKTPILVLVGEYDQGITAEAMSQTILEWFPKATIDVIQNSGHFPMLETPARLATVMENYLVKHG
ncbi:alpha/beta hydrolase [Paremcibacter congregatus]|uniref:alpha/beta fold hydrolase n=1 Tax=Paremcibacter congregatus TaxID=2043170 RepID=UPI0030EEE8CA|tara:strand:+ start:3528 stop:4301 length:774 start_codon:yes stop_codon:yes gene_type:complete